MNASKHSHHKDHKNKTFQEKLENHLREIEDTGYLGMFEKIIDIGYCNDPEYLRGFDLTSWDRPNIECVIEEKSCKKFGKHQKVKIKGLYKQAMELGFTTIPMMIAEIERSLPIEHHDNPSCTSELLGCPWKIDNIRYYRSLNNLTEIEKIDLT